MKIVVSMAIFAAVSFVGSHVAESVDTTDEKFIVAFLAGVIASTVADIAKESMR